MELMAKKDMRRSKVRPKEGYWRVDMNEAVFENLCDIYIDPCEAVVRELISNAIDASEEGGKIEIRYSNGRFSVKDHGCGMSEETLIENYLGYFNSTVEYDMAKIGSFGIGSKSPLSLSNHYRVSTCDGFMKTEADIYHTRDGLMAKTDKRRCLSERGTEVTVYELEHDDIESIASHVKDHVRNALRNRYFINGEEVKVPEPSYDKTLDTPFGKVRVTMCGGNLQNCLRLYSNVFGSFETFDLKKMRYLSGRNSLCSLYACVNDISYPLNEGEEEYGIDVCLRFSPGTLKFTPTREEIPVKSRKKIDALLEWFGEEHLSGPGLGVLESLERFYENDRLKVYRENWEEIDHVIKRTRRIYSCDFSPDRVVNQKHSNSLVLNLATARINHECVFVESSNVNETDRQIKNVLDRYMNDPSVRKKLKTMKVILYRKEASEDLEKLVRNVSGSTVPVELYVFKDIESFDDHMRERVQNIS